MMLGGVAERHLLKLCTPPLRAAQLLLQHALVARDRAVDPAAADGPPDLGRFAQVLADRGYHVWLRTGACSFFSACAVQREKKEGREVRERGGKGTALRRRAAPASSSRPLARWRMQGPVPARARLSCFVLARFEPL